MFDSSKDTEMIISIPLHIDASGQVYTSIVAVNKDEVSTVKQMLKIFIGIAAAGFFIIIIIAYFILRHAFQPVCGGNRFGKSQL